MVTVEGKDYDIGFVEGCFTSNDLAANLPLYPGCGTGYTTPDLYANRDGVLTSQPWWGKADLALAIANAYQVAAVAAKAAALAANPGTNDCAYLPNLNGGIVCADSPYFAYAANSSPPYYDGYMFYEYGSTIDYYTRQSGYFAVVQSAPASGPSSVPGPLPILGLAAAFGFSRKLRKRIKLHKATSAVSASPGA